MPDVESVQRSYRPIRRQPSVDTSYVVYFGGGLHTSVDRSIVHSQILVFCTMQIAQATVSRPYSSYQKAKATCAAYDITAAKMYAITPVKISD